MPLASPPSSVVYFCKDCQKIVPAKKEARRYVYICNICGTKNVAFGTQKSIENFYHVENVVVENAGADGDKKV